MTSGEIITRRLLLWAWGILWPGVVAWFLWSVVGVHDVFGAPTYGPLVFVGLALLFERATSFIGTCLGGALWAAQKEYGDINLTREAVQDARAQEAAESGGSEE